MVLLFVALQVSDEVKKFYKFCDVGKVDMPTCIGGTSVCQCLRSGKIAK